MLCGVVCVSLSLVSTFVLTTMLQRRDPVVSREDRLELQKDVEAAEVLAAVAAVLYMSYLWRTLFRAHPAPPQPSLEGYKEEKQHEGGPLRRPSEHKETQYQLPEDARHVTVETQTSEYLVPAGWASSDLQFSNSSLSLMAPPSDTQMYTSSSGTLQQPVSEGHQKHPPVTSVEPYLPVESPQSEIWEITTSQSATDPQLYATLAKAQLPPNAGDVDTPPNSASDVSSPEVDSGLIVIREPAVDTPRKPQTLTVSLAAGQSPRRPTPSPRQSERSNSSVPTQNGGSYARRNKPLCLKCRPKPGGQGTTQATDGAGATTVRVTAVPSSATARGGGDAPLPRGVPRPPAAARGRRPPGKNHQPPDQTYTSLHYRPEDPKPRTQTTCLYKQPFV